MSRYLFIGLLITAVPYYAMDIDTGEYDGCVVSDAELEQSARDLVLLRDSSAMPDTIVIPDEYKQACQNECTWREESMKKILVKSASLVYPMSGDDKNLRRARGGGFILNYATVVAVHRQRRALQQHQLTYMANHLIAHHLDGISETSFQGPSEEQKKNMKSLRDNIEKVRTMNEMKIARKRKFGVYDDKATDYNRASSSKQRRR